MIFFLGLIKSLSWQTWVLVAVLAGCVFVYVEKTAHIDLLEHDLSAMTAKRDALQKEIDEAKALAVKTQAEYETKERQTAADQKEITDESQRMVARARADAAVPSHDRLLERVAAVAGGGQTPSDSASAVGSPTTSGAGLLLADVLRKSDERSGQLAEYADQTRIAGQACERSYDALSP